MNTDELKTIIWKKFIREIFVTKCVVNDVRIRLQIETCLRKYFAPIPSLKIFCDDKNNNHDVIKERRLNISFIDTNTNEKITLSFP